MKQQTEEYIVKIITNQMGLDQDHCWIASQNRKIPPQAQELFCVVGTSFFRPISSKSHFDADTNEEIQEVYGRADVQVDLFSRNNDARIRRDEVLMALSSFYSKNVQDEGCFRIFEIPTFWNNTSYLEGSSSINRFTLIIPTMVWTEKRIPTAIYTSFQAEIDDEQGKMGDIDITQFTLNVNVSPSNAICSINGIETTTYTAEKGQEVNISITCEGYESYTDTIVLTEDQNLDISLSKFMILNDQYIKINPNILSYSLERDITSKSYVIKGNNASIDLLTTVFPNFLQDGKNVYITTENITPELKSQYGDYIYNEFVMRVRIPELAPNEITNAGLVILPLTTFNRYFTQFMVKSENNNYPSTMVAQDSSYTNFIRFNISNFGGYKTGDWIDLGVKPILLGNDNLKHLSLNMYLPRTDNGGSLPKLSDPTGNQLIYTPYLFGRSYRSETSKSNIEIDLAQTGFKINDEWAFTLAIQDT